MSLLPQSTRLSPVLGASLPSCANRLSRVRVFLCLITSIASICADGQNPATTVTVDAAANQHAINPNIYGVAFGDATTLSDLNSPINRYGGNNSTRYNWQINADNRAADWYFESIGHSIATPGQRGDPFYTISRHTVPQDMDTLQKSRG